MLTLVILISSAIHAHAAYMCWSERRRYFRLCAEVEQDLSDVKRVKDEMVQEQTTFHVQMQRAQAVVRRGLN
jgi:hypothetical protein